MRARGITLATGNLALVCVLLFVTIGVAVTATEPEQFSGLCVGVTDGDTISVMRDDRTVKVRLEGIDCPEHGQDFSNVAKQHTSSLVYNKTVEVHQTGVDRYGRILATVYVDGIDVNLSLVEAGLAWHFKKYSADPQLAAAEAAARTARVGLWALPSPTPPWEWRGKKRTS